MDNNCKNEGRRDFLKKSTAIAVLTAATPILLKAAENDEIWSLKLMDNCTSFL